MHTCTDPPTARSILCSDFEYADYNCIFIFSREYHLNICVHFYYINVNTNEEEVSFCHYKVNNTQNFIHLHLLNQHFTPYIETDRISLNDSMTSQQMQDHLLETSSDIENDNEDDEVPLSNNTAVDDDNAMELDEVTFPVYTDYRKHSNGHLDFYKDFIKNTFGHSCAVCDRLWWKNDLKKSSDQHNNILCLIIPVIIYISLYKNELLKFNFN